MSSQSASAVHDESSGLDVAEDIEWSSAGRIVASGFAMGSADIVPGVSGGTMAVATGIYSELLAAIASINLTTLTYLKRFDLSGALKTVHWRFLLSLFFGIGLAVVLMVKLVELPRLLVTNTSEVYAVFFGLVLASVWILGKSIAWNSGRFLALVAGAALGFAVVNLVPVDTPSNPLFMFAYGMIAISAMLLPGISGSFILLILGQYEVIIGAIEDLIHLQLGAFAIVLPFGLGCVFGITGFSRLVSWMLRKFHDPVVAALTGLLLGSLWRIWPYQHTVTQEVRGKLKTVEATPYLPDSLEINILLLTLAGLGGVLLLEWIAGRRKLA
ncbi:MAG: DUF368 domain-containing protein [Polyangiaceae bacterium]|nr:DUF368 domain-containing protein [Polyangiaceae bacterium]